MKNFIVAKATENKEALEKALLSEDFVKISDNLWVYADIDYEADGTPVLIDGIFYPEKEYGRIYETVEHVTVERYVITLTWNGTELEYTNAQKLT